MNYRRPELTVGFDGLHRVGKGTQVELLNSVVVRNGAKSVTVRGDGTREGLGLYAGDPYSDEWQKRSARLKSGEGSTVEAWNAASYVLLREFDELVNKNPSSDLDVILVDRSVLSRAAFLLHRGVGVEGERFTLEDLYPDNLSVPPGERVDIERAIPDIIFDLQVDSPQRLLERLDVNDPKYTFRARNIKGGFRSAQIASQHLPEAIEDRVVRLDATASVETVHLEVVRLLGSTALSRFLHD